VVLSLAWLKPIGFIGRQRHRLVCNRMVVQRPLTLCLQWGGRVKHVTYIHTYIHSTEITWQPRISNIGISHLYSVSTTALFGFVYPRNNCYKILIGKSERKRPVARPGRRWEDVTSIHLALNRDMWRVLVFTVSVNLRVPWRAGSLLSSWSIMKFSRCTPLCVIIYLFIIHGFELISIYICTCNKRLKFFQITIAVRLFLSLYTRILCLMLVFFVFSEGTWNFSFD
jgi:hypothetical protein